MNKIYRILRDASGNWVVAPETSKGRKKGGVVVALTISALMSMSQLAAANDAVLGTFNPNDNDNQVGAAVVGNGDTVDLTGSLDSVASGSDGPYAVTTWQELLDQGHIESGAEFIGPDVVRIFGLQSRDTYVTAPDSITGSNLSVAVYDNSKIVTADPILGSDVISLSRLVNPEQYVDLRLGTVDSTGGTLNVKLDNGGSEQKMLVAKQTALVYADGTGTNASDVNWTSKNSFYFHAAVESSSDTKSYAVDRIAQFPEDKKIIGYDGTTEFAMASIDDLKTYNSWLIAELEAGRLDPTKYDYEFKRAVGTTTGTITYELPPASPGGEGSTPSGLVNVIRASGSNATGTLTATGEITAQGTLGGIMRADNGGKIVNEGVISQAKTKEGQYDPAVLVVTDAGSQGFNNGVVNAGLTLNEDGSIGAVGTAGAHGALVMNGARFENGANGVINVGTARDVEGGVSEGIRVDTNAMASNHGAINVGVAGTTSINGAVGARVHGGGSFVNEKEGVIYIGRGPQSAVGDVTSDVALNTSTGVFGIALGTNGSAENAGRIVIGSQTDHATAMRAFDTGSRGQLVNSGTIDILGAVQNAVPAENIGMAAVNATNVYNTGTINVGSSGELVVNAIALKAYDKNGGASKITSTGIINIEGDAALDRRNYGAWAQGAKSEVVLGGGAVNLKGDGAIGVHSREAGKITVDSGTVNFVQGENQIGFFAYGKDASGNASTIDIKSSPAAGLEVSTAGSTLFRIEDGAVINNDAGAKLIASGERSTALHATGVGSVANLNGMNIEVSGKDAVGVRVDGGAIGSMSGTPGIVLKEDGATAVVVDNNKRSLSGVEQASAPGVQSVFTNNADEFEVSGAQNMTAFQVKNGAQLINAGDIHVAHGTGIEIVGVGSSVVADASGKRGTIIVQGNASFTTVDGGVGGTDRLVFDGAQYTYNDSANAIQNFDTVQLSNNSTVTMQTQMKVADDGSSNLIDIDAGSTLAVAPTAKEKGNTLYVEPQAQVIVSNYRAGDHTEQNGTVVSNLSSTNVTTRLGVRTLGTDTSDASRWMSTTGTVGGRSPPS